MSAEPKKMTKEVTAGKDEIAKLPTKNEQQNKY